MNSVVVFDPAANDSLSKVRGVGRYMQILRENFPKWIFTDRLPATNYPLPTTFINPFFNFLQPPLIMKRVANRQIAIIHDLIPLKYSKHFPIGLRGKINVFLNKLALKNYDIIVTDSEASKKDISEKLKVKSEKIKVIYPCLPKSFQHSAPNNNNLPSIIYKLPPNYCLYVGDATWNKNIVNLARAIKEMNVTCVFVGKVFTSSTIDHPWQAELKGFMEEVKDDERFIFPGFVSDEDLLGLYQNAKCNILISRDEGFGFSFLEAASQNCPSVLSDIPVLRETAQDSAIFCNPVDINSIANATGKIYFNKKARDAYGAKSKKQSNNFSTISFRTVWNSTLIDKK